MYFQLSIYINMDKRLNLLRKRVIQALNLLLASFPASSPHQYLLPAPAPQALFFHFMNKFQSKAERLDFRGKPFSLLKSEKLEFLEDLGLQSVDFQIQQGALKFKGELGVRWDKKPLLLFYVSGVPELGESKGPLNECAKVVTDQTADLPTSLQNQYVYKVYDAISQHFSHTRYKPWPKVVQFIRLFDHSHLLLDLGCGNGKYMGIHQGPVLGCDRSIGLLQQAREAGHQTCALDCLMIPFRDGIADVTLSIAVIHHLSTKGQRVRAVRQMLRVMRKEGRGLIYVWAMEQGGFEQQDMFVNWNLQERFQKGQQQLSDTTYLKEKKVRVYKRYYHLFVKGELEGLVAEAGGRVIQDWYDQENWAVVFTHF